MWFLKLYSIKKIYLMLFHKFCWKCFIASSPCLDFCTCLCPFEAIWRVDKLYTRTVELVVYIQSFLVLLYITSCFVFVSVLRFFFPILAHVFVLDNNNYKKKKCSCFCNVTWFDSLNYGFILVLAYYFIHFFCWHIVVTQNVLNTQNVLR
jgi:hypothetical protein